MINENLSGSFGSIVIPLMYSGVKLSLMATMAPGAGKFNGAAALPWAKTALGGVIKLKMNVKEMTTERIRWPIGCLRQDKQVRLRRKERITMA
jgi:hypothetical protein